MICEIPTAAEFEEAGARFFNIAWEMVIKHALHLAEAEEWDEETSEATAIEAYWNAAQGDVLVALSLVQNGVDHLLKSRIAAVSPFLLIAAAPRDWPRGCDKQDTAFADFRTIDAQDLLRAHDAVVPNRVPTSFRTKHEALRRTRNAVLHSVDRRLTPVAAEVVSAVLHATHVLLGQGSWIVKRRAALTAAPSFTLYYDGGVASHLHREVRAASEMLGASDASSYLGIDKGRRMYTCPTCLRDYYDSEHAAGIFPQGVAQLESHPGSKLLRCVVCGTSHEVVREKCSNDECLGDVIDPDNYRCLTCHTHC